MNKIPSPLDRPTEYISGLVGIVLLVLTDAGTEINDSLLISIPILAGWITTGLVSVFWRTRKPVDDYPEGADYPDA